VVDWNSESMHLPLTKKKLDGLDFGDKMVLKRSIRHFIIVKRHLDFFTIL